jgi:hypothetical protein
MNLFKKLFGTKEMSQKQTKVSNPILQNDSISLEKSPLLFYDIYINGEFTFNLQEFNKPLTLVDLHDVAALTFSFISTQIAQNSMLPLHLDFVFKAIFELIQKGLNEGDYSMDTEGIKQKIIQLRGQRNAEIICDLFIPEVFGIIEKYKKDNQLPVKETVKCLSTCQVDIKEPLLTFFYYMLLFKSNNSRKLDLSVCQFPISIDLLMIYYRETCDKLGFEQGKDYKLPVVNTQ